MFIDVSQVANDTGVGDGMTACCAWARAAPAASPGGSCSSSARPCSSSAVRSPVSISWTCQCASSMSRVRPSSSPSSAHPRLPAYKRVAVFTSATTAPQCHLPRRACTPPPSQCSPPPRPRRRLPLRACAPSPPPLCSPP
uniref:Uncharacterized protein n=1 Tax=Arundo donax TaxID=35708 RepID=A0A0A9B299_ARUDO